jgi:hypothetical protein
MDATEIRLEEYKTLRQEILTTMSNRISILTFGLASISVILAASIAKYTPDGTPFNTLFPGLALTLAIPVVSILILFMWLGEYERMQRAGSFLTLIEDHVNREEAPEGKEKNLLSWETWLRKNRGHMAYPYNMTVILLLLISSLSLMSGLLMVGPYIAWTAGQILKWGLASSLALHVVVYCYMFFKIRKLHRTIAKLLNLTQPSY